MWVTAPGSSKGCGRDPAVGQVDEDSCGQPSLFVWVGEGELAFAPVENLSARTPAEAATQLRRRQDPQGRNILRPVKHQKGAEGLEYSPVLYSAWEEETSGCWAVQQEWKCPCYFILSLMIARDSCQRYSTLFVLNLS